MTNESRPVKKALASLFAVASGLAFSSAARAQTLSGRAAPASALAAGIPAPIAPMPSTFSPLALIPGGAASVALPGALAAPDAPAPVVAAAAPASAEAAPVLAVEALPVDPQAKAPRATEPRFQILVQPGAEPAKVQKALDELFDAHQAMSRTGDIQVTNASFKLGPFTLNAGMDARIAKELVKGLAPSGRTPQAPGVDILIDTSYRKDLLSLHVMAENYYRYAYMHETAGLTRELAQHPLNPARWFSRDKDEFADYAAQGRTLAHFTEVLAARLAASRASGAPLVKGKGFLAAAGEAAFRLDLWRTQAAILAPYYARLYWVESTQWLKHGPPAQLARFLARGTARGIERAIDGLRLRLALAAVRIQAWRESSRK